MKTDTKIKTITPEIAAEMLSIPSPLQRSLNWNRAATYAQIMRNGDWLLTHQGIMLGLKSEVLDGQNRLKAITISGRSIQIMVTQIIEASPLEIKALFDALDFGKPRSVAFTLQSIHGMTNATRTTAAIAVIIAICCRFKPTQTVDIMCDVHKMFKSELDYVNELAANHKPFQRGALIGVCAFAAKVGDHTIDKFIIELFSGENIKKGDPAHTLREAVQNMGDKRIKQKFIPSLALWTASSIIAELETRKISKVVAAYGPLDELCEMLPSEVEKIRKLVGQMPSNLKRSLVKPQAKMLGA